MNGSTTDDLLYDCRLALLGQLGGTVNWLASVDLDALVGRERAIIGSILDDSRLFAGLLDHKVGDLLLFSRPDNT